MKDLTDPTNVDSVPAMLTPGEYVLNKEASEMYAPIIEQMNQAGLQQRHAENMGGQPQGLNNGGRPIPKNRIEMKFDKYGRLVPTGKSKSSKELGFDPASYDYDYPVPQATGHNELVANLVQSAEAKGGAIDYNALAAIANKNLAEKQNANEAQTRKFLEENPQFKVPGGSQGYVRQEYNTGGLVDFLKEKEGYRDEAYQDSAGVWTIGYGRTKNPDGSPIKPGQKTKKQTEDAWLQQRAATDRKATEAFAKEHGYEWNPQQIDALSSFRYNIGNLKQLTKNGTRSNEEIMEYLPQYNKAGGQFVQGLQNRRDAELELFGGQPQVQEVPAPGSFQDIPAPSGLPPQPAPESSFGDAFAAARRAHGGGGGTFEFGGQQYTTDYEEEVAMRNTGGPIHLNDGGSSWWQRLLAPKAGFNQQGIPLEDEERRLLEQQAMSAAGFSGVPVGAEFPGLPAGATSVPALNMPAPSVDERFQAAQSATGSNVFPQEQELGALQGRAEFSVPPALDTVPNIPLPPPNSDEALLQGSSQSVEEAAVDPVARKRYNLEKQLSYSSNGLQRAIRQGRLDKFNAANPQSPSLQGPAMDSFPGAIPETAQPNEVAAPISQVTNPSEIAQLPIGDPARNAAIEQGVFVPTEADLAWEEQAYQTGQALQQAQLQAAVTAPDAPGAEFIQNRVDVLSDQLQSLQAPTLAFDWSMSSSAKALDKVTPLISLLPKLLSAIRVSLLVAAVISTVI